jgi:hypothetical protein
MPKIVLGLGLGLVLGLVAVAVVVVVLVGVDLWKVVVETQHWGSYYRHALHLLLLTPLR